MLFQPIIAKASGSSSGAKYGDLDMYTILTKSGNSTSTSLTSYTASVLKLSVMNDLTANSLFFIVSLVGEAPITSGLTQIGDIITMDDADGNTVYYGVYQWIDTSQSVTFTRTSSTSARYNVLGVAISGAKSLEYVGKWTDTTTDTTQAYTYTNSVVKADDYPELIVFNYLAASSLVTEYVLAQGDGVAFSNRTESTGSYRLLPILAHGSASTIWLTRHTSAADVANTAACLYFKVTPMSE